MSKNIIRRIINRLLHLLARLLPGATSIRPYLHRLRGVKIGDNVWIGDDVYLDNEYPEFIEIQSRVGIGMKAIIVAHTRGPGKIIIEEDAYIGTGSVLVCPSGRTIRIGKSSMIGPGCVITSSVPPHVFIAAPKSKPIAKITVPFGAASSVEDFFAGLKPWKKRNKP